MSEHFEKMNIKDLEEWRSGDPLEARKLQQPITVLQALGGVRPGQQVFNGGVFFEVRMFKVLRLEEDVIICNFTNGTTSQDDEVKVALPFLLRRTPFDVLSTRAGISYVYSDFNQRVATNSDGDTEDQIIVDSYEADDFFFAARGIFGGSGVFHDDSRTIPVVWQDMNFDGRYWALDEEAE